MSIEIKVPSLPESVSDATVAKWYKQAGETVNRDDHLVDLETDKVMLEVTAPQSGVIEKIIVNEGETATENTVLAVLQEGSVGVAKASEKAKESEKIGKTEEGKEESSEDGELGPAVRRLVTEHDIDIKKVVGTGKGGRVSKQDVEQYIQTKSKPEGRTVDLTSQGETTSRLEQRVPMTRLRARIAERLVTAQHEAAILTTFNEVNMQPIMDLRNKYKDVFEKTHGVRLGFMSFFTKACVEALKRFPVINASIDGNDILYHNFYDVGIAIGGGPRGLVVPILRNVETLSMASIEKQIREYGEKVKNNKLSIEEMTGGTFTITNGGVFGSLLSTPILNPPQSAILGMHKIMERPIVENSQMVIRPMMYVALSYDHRIIDGSESVQFLVSVKELLEDPARLLLEI